MAKLVKGGRGGFINQFEKGESGNRNGRPRKIATQLKVEGYTQEQIYDTFQKIGALTKDEFETFTKDKNLNLIEAGVCRMFSDFAGKKAKTELLDYLVPKKTKEEKQISINLMQELPKDPVEASKVYQELMKG